MDSSGRFACEGTKGQLGRWTYMTIGVQKATVLGDGKKQKKE